ncbi:MAG: class I SAM-dependent methyltransferase, partial [bacterium]
KIKKIKQYLKNYYFIIKIYQLYITIKFIIISLWEKWYLKKTSYLTRVNLRYRVHGCMNLKNFLEVGKKCAQDIESELLKINKKIDSFEKILDFGCGCGRILNYFKNTSATLYGTDIDKKAIKWCSQHLPFAEFNSNNALPCLKYSSNMFDFIYAISIFTHLNKEYQLLWLREFQRIIKPQGILILSIHGEYCFQNLSKIQKENLEKQGTIFVITNVVNNIFPKWYQTSYHTKKYIFNEFGKYFKILNYVDQGLNNHQDMVILQNDKK